VVDLLKQHTQEGGRMEPTEFIERGERIAVGMTVSNPRWHGEASPDIFKVFIFEGDNAVLLQDCAGRDDALGYLT
jgi:hypothetical protein